jgi:hypothetical protein
LQTEPNGLARRLAGGLAENASMLLEFGAVEATLTFTGLTSAGAKEKILALVPCGNESAGG